MNGYDLDSRFRVTLTETTPPERRAPAPPVTPPVPPPPADDDGPIVSGVPSRIIVCGTDAGGPGEVTLRDETGAVRRTFQPYGPNFRGGVRASSLVAPGGAAAVATAPGPGVAPRVFVFDAQTGEILRDTLAFEESFVGGVFIGAADLTGDGVAELILSPDRGGGPRVRVLDGVTGATVADFFAIDDPNFRGGVRAAAGDVNGDGTPDLIVGAGFGGGPRVAIFDGKTLGPSLTPARLVPDFFLFDQRLRNGVFLGAGDLNGDGAADLIAGAGPGGGPRVFAVDGREFVASGGTRQVPLANFFGGDPAGRGGVRVAARDLDGDDRADLVVAPGSGAGAVVVAYRGAGLPGDGVPAELSRFPLGDGAFAGGVFVG